MHETDGKPQLCPHCSTPDKPVVGEVKPNPDKPTESIVQCPKCQASWSLPA